MLVARFPWVLLAIAACGGSQDELGDTAGSPILVNDFDEATGANTYFELDADNWTENEVIAPNAGSQSLASGNGNEDVDFMGLGIEKELGGAIEDRVYEVSFYVAQDLDDSMPIELADFTELWIGASAGTMEWTQTPVPEVVDTWVQWKGRFSPGAADVGQPFLFHAVFDLPGKHSIAIDGPVSVSPLP